MKSYRILFLPLLAIPLFIASAFVSIEKASAQVSHLTSPWEQNTVQINHENVNVTPEMQQPDAQNTEADQPDLGKQMLDFFDGLSLRVKDVPCENIAATIESYYKEHQTWINDLDYASVSIDDVAAAEIQSKARALGKTLSVCYGYDEIPKLLKRYADFGDID